MAFRFLHSEDEDDEEEEADEQQDDEDADDLACGDRFNKPTDWESISFRLFAWDEDKTVVQTELVSFIKLECVDEVDSIDADEPIVSFISKARLDWALDETVDGVKLDVKAEVVVVIVADDAGTTSSGDAGETWADVELAKLANSIIVSFALADWSSDVAWGSWSCAWACGCTDFLLDSMVMIKSFTSAKFSPRVYRLISNELDATSIFNT